ncbi:MAG: ATP-grasp fold amidoligase family protein [Vibrio litoralis]|uniref:ATP-grasp fold amidoligase family protein n=1 Tax=Vibrio litoralis TaxID=335972 RepID=UPI003F9A711C
MLNKHNISKFFKFIPDRMYCYMLYVIAQKKLPNLKKPVKFNEKLLLKKIALRPSKEYSLRELIVDRYLVRDYIDSKNSGVSLIKLLWHGYTIDKNAWDKLPQKFVIKANHGSQMVKIVDKSVDCLEDIMYLTSSWVENDYSVLGREWVYKNTDRKLIVEEFISFNGDIPPDYKFHCFNGKVEMLQVDIDRFGDRAKNLYDRDFSLLDGTLGYKRGELIPKPSNFDKAIKIAESLSKDFDYIRVDLYLVNDIIYFGELTNFPGNCCLVFKPSNLDNWLGNKWDNITNIE